MLLWTKLQSVPLSSCPPSLLGGVVYPCRAHIWAPSAISVPDFCPLSVWLNSWVSQALHQRRSSAKTSMPRWIKQTQQTTISVVGTSYCWKEGTDCIFMILNYKYLTIWGIRVGTTDDASGKCCLVAVGEDLKSCSWKEVNQRKMIIFYSVIKIHHHFDSTDIFTITYYYWKVPNILILILLVRPDLSVLQFESYLWGLVVAGT